MKLVAFSGFARSGKDSAVQALVEDGWTRIAFADKLRQYLYLLNPIIDIDVDYETVIGLDSGDPIRIFPSRNPIRLQEVIDQFGWDGYKDGRHSQEIRELLQRLGGFGRELLSKNLWIDATLDSLDPNGMYGISDSRYLNEFEAVENRGGIVIRIDRPGVGPVNDHPSELEALQCDFKHVIHNDGTLEEFQQEVRNLVSECFN